MKEYIRICKGNYNPNNSHFQVELPGVGYFFRWRGEEGDGVGAHWILSSGGYYDYLCTYLDGGRDIPYTEESWSKLKALRGRMRAVALNEFHRVTGQLFADS